MDPYSASPAVAPPPPRSLLPGLAPGPQVGCTLAAGGARRGAGSLTRRCGPVVGAGLASSEPLSGFPVRRDSRRGAPEPLRRLRRIRPAGRVPLTSVARLIRASSGAFRRRSARRRFASRQLSRAPPLRVLSLRPRRHSLPRRSLSPPAQARAHGRASLPRSPSPRHLCGRVCAVGPRSPFGLRAACLARPGPAHFGSLADPPALPVLFARPSPRPVGACARHKPGPVPVGIWPNAETPSRCWAAMRPWAARIKVMRIVIFFCC